MSRIRTVKPEFWTDEKINSIDRDAALMFIGIWNHSDDNGIHPAKPKEVQWQVFPGGRASLKSVEKWIGQLLKVQLIIQYAIKGKEYWIVPNWHKHQRIDKPHYKYPAPNGVVNARFEENSETILGMVA